MGLLSGIYDILYKKYRVDEKTHFIFYKIVDSLNEGEEFVIQCINTNGIFNATIMDIIFDIDILHGLHPIQACYIGIEYSKFLKKGMAPFKFQDNQRKLKKYSVFRYGTYQLSYQDRKGNICFANYYTGEVFIMDPRDIAFSESLIKEFDAAQAFHIGLFAGVKLNHVGSRADHIPNIRLLK